MVLRYGCRLGVEKGGEREQGGKGGDRPCSEALLRAFYELLAWIEARTVRNAEA